MKRTPLRRSTTPMAQGKPLRRTELARGATSLGRRKRLVPVSIRRMEERPERADMRELVFARDQQLCRLAAWADGTPGCRGHLTVHHLRKAGQGGPYTLINLVTLCAGHNGWVEDEPDLAHELGLVVRRGDTYGEAWRRLVTSGLVDYWWTGQPPPARCTDA